MTYLMWAPSVLLGAESRSGSVPKPKWQTCFLTTPTPPALLAIKHVIAGDPVSPDTFINLLVESQDFTAISSILQSRQKHIHKYMCAMNLCNSSEPPSCVFFFVFLLWLCIKWVFVKYKSLLVDAVTTLACCQKASLSIDGHLNDKFGLCVFLWCHQPIIIVITSFFCHMTFMAQVISLKESL